MSRRVLDRRNHLRTGDRLTQTTYKPEGRSIAPLRTPGAPSSRRLSLFL